MKTSIINNIIANREQLDNYFSFYKERFFHLQEQLQEHLQEHLQEENHCKTKSIQLALAGKNIELRFSTEKLLQPFIPSLGWAMECGKSAESPFTAESPSTAESATNAESSTNAELSSNEKTVFYIWQDDILNYLPQDSQKGDIWHHKSESANISIRPRESYISAYDYDNKEGYFCIKSTDTIDIAHTAHPFKPLFHSWAQQNGLLFVHSAGIEIEGVGILISGVGGRGKSTTAVSALLNGCGFIGDDYVLLGDSDKKKGYPIYMSAFMNPDMINEMEELKPWIVDIDHKRKQKTLIDLVKVKGYFKKEITIGYILLPNVVDSEMLSIKKVPPASALSQMIFSSAKQNGERTNKVFMQQVFAFMKGLPVYQFNMSSDPQKNIKYLKKFTNEWRKENV